MSVYLSAATCPDMQLTFKTAQLSTSQPCMSQRVKTCTWLVTSVSDFITDVTGSLHGPFPGKLLRRVLSVFGINGSDCLRTVLYLDLTLLQKADHDRHSVASLLVNLARADTVEFLS